MKKVSGKNHNYYKLVVKTTIHHVHNTKWLISRTSCRERKVLYGREIVDKWNHFRIKPLTADSFISVRASCGCGVGGGGVSNRADSWFRNLIEYAAQNPIVMFTSAPFTQRSC